MAENEVVIKSGKHIAVGEVEWEIRDTDARTVFVDFFTENRINNGLIYVSLGSVHTDAQNAPVVDVSTRLRMDLGFAQTLRELLGELINGAMKPVDKSQAN